MTTRLTENTVKEINAEQVKNLAFATAADWMDETEAREQNQRIHLSILMSQKQQPVKIVFNTINGYCQLNAPIWGATEKFILLQGGNCIPVESVAHVVSE